MSVGVWVSVGLLRSPEEENERKTDPSHKPFRPSPGFCADRTRRKQSLGRFYHFWDGCQPFGGTTFHTARRLSHLGHSRSFFPTAPK